MHEFTPHHCLCPCGTVFEDFHGHQICFSCKIGTLNFDKVSTAVESSLEKEIVTAAAKSGRSIERAHDADRDKRDFVKVERPVLSDSTKRLIHQVHGR